MLYYQKSVDETLTELDSSLRGLSLTEAEERLKIHGRNTFSGRSTPIWRKLIEPFANVFMLVLAVAVIISMYHGDTFDAFVIGFIMLASAIIYYIQRFSTDRILRSLQTQTPQLVSTLRDGSYVECAAEQLVPGDIIIMHEGDKVPADARLVETQSLRVDEAQLTGESEPISKHAELITGNKELYEQANILFQGSFVVSGEAYAVVVATGNNTEFGHLASLAVSTSSDSPVQKKIDKLLSQIIAVVVAIAVIAFLLSIFEGMELTASIKFVMALAVSAVPESLPVAISVVLVLGMRRMAKRNALVRSIRAIESVGLLTTIATDKTGTLTKNKLTVRTVWHDHITTSHFMRVLAHATNYSESQRHDPLDTALYDYAISSGTRIPHHQPYASLSFDQVYAMSGNIWHEGKAYILAIKGAPEQILARCDLTEGEYEVAMHAVHELTSQGYRVLGLAETVLTEPVRGFNELSKKQHLEFSGFVGVADILRPEAKRSIAAALAAGVTVRMITGDHYETAYHIGRELGMVTDRDQVFDSRTMGVMSDDELDDVIERTRIFSRVTPEHKYRILSILKRHNITAMTGDGVNDVPALANAHVGVAMGSGSHIARDASDIILLDDNFKSIIDAIREGRAIFAGIRRMLFYLLSTNGGEALTLVGSLIIGLPVPLLPVQILWVNLVTDTSMVIPLGLEPGETSYMKQRPKSPRAPILSGYIISRMILIALTMAALTLSLYAFYDARYGADYARTIAFCSLVVMQWANAFNARSETKLFFASLRTWNAKFYIGLAIAITLQILAVLGPLQPLLHVAPVAIGDIVITSVIAFVVPIILCDLHKLLGRKLS